MECYFCKHNLKEVNLSETEILRRFISALGKIKSRKKTGVCAKHQKKLAKAIKKARHVGLLPTVI